MRQLLALLLLGVPASAQGWYNGSWTYRKLVSIKHERIIGTSTNYVALVSFRADSDIAGHIQSACQDLVITSASGTTLPHAIVKCSASSGDVQALVNVGTVAPDHDVPLLVYWGNAGASDQSNPTGVWSSSHKLAMIGGAATDYSASNLTVTINGTAPTVVDGQYGKALRFNGSNYLTLSPPAVSTAYTFEFWFRADSNPLSNAQLLPMIGTDNTAYGFYWDTYWLSHFFFSGWGASGPNMVGENSLTPAANMWNYMVETWDGSTVTAYVNGRKAGTYSTSSLASHTVLYIAGAAAHANRVDIGDVRVSNIAKSTGTIATTAQNYWHPETFMAIGGVETNVSGTPIIHSFDANYNAVESGKPARLRWLVSGADSVTIDNSVGAQTDLISGTAAIAPTSTTTYTLTAHNASGDTTATKTVSVLTGTVVYGRYGGPMGSWTKRYDPDPSSHAVMENWEPDWYEPGDYILQFGNCSDNAGQLYASNLNGVFQVADVIDTAHYTIKDMTGSYVTANGGATYCHPAASGQGAIWTGRAVPQAIPGGPRTMYDGKDGKTTRHVATSTDNGLVSLIVSGATARATFTYTVDSQVGQKVSVWNTTSSALNGERTISAVGSDWIEFESNGAPDDNYTHNDVCGPSAGDPNIIGGTANCVVVSFFAISTNTYWNNIVTTSTFANSAAYMHVFDGGTRNSWAGAFLWPYIDAAHRILVDRSSARQTQLDAVIYFITHQERMYGVGWPIMVGSDEGGSHDEGHTWMFDHLGEYIPYTVADYLGHLTSEQKSRYADMILNDVEDPSDQCTPIYPQQQVIATGTVQGGSSDPSSIILAADDPTPVDGYVNRIVTWNNGSRQYWGVITAYDSGHVATVGTIWSASSNTDTYPTSETFWPTPTNQTYKILASATISGSTLTGYGTNWTTSLHVGDAVVLQQSWLSTLFPEDQYYIASITNDTTATVRFGSSATGSSTPQSIWWIPGWSQADKHCGRKWWVNHSSGAMGPQPIIYDGMGGVSAGKLYNRWAPAYNDEGGGAEAYLMSMGSALADQDPRAISVFEEAQSLWWEYDGRFMLGYHGMTSNSSHYGSAETNAAALNALVMTGTLPDLFQPLLTSSLFTGWQIRREFELLPDRPADKPLLFVYGTNNSEPIVQYNGKTLSWATDVASLVDYTSDQAAYSRSFIHVHGLDYAYMYPHYLFLMADPRVSTTATYSEQRTQYLFAPSAADIDLCKTASGADHPLLGCDAQRGDTAYSRAAWTDPSTTQLMFEARSCCSCCYDYPSAGLLRLYKVGHLIGVDSTNGNLPTWTMEDTTEHGSMPRFNEQDTLRYQGQYYGISQANMARWRHDGTSWDRVWGDESNNVMYAMADLTGSYTTTYNHVWTHEIHFKKPGTEEILVQFNDIDASNVPPANGIRFGVHFMQNGETGNPNGEAPPYDEGVTTCPGPNGCAGLNIDRVIFSHEDGHAADTNPARTAGVITKWFSPDTITVRDDGDNYSGAYHHAHRVSICAGNPCGSATSTLEAITVSKVVPDYNADSTLTAAALNPSSNWTGVQTADKVALFARGGTLKTSAALTTTHSGTAQYLVAGLAAGSYNVTVDTTPVTGSPFTVTDGDNSLYFETTAGNVSIASADAPCSITTGSLPPGTQGVAYFQTLASSNCSAPLTWTIASGTICSGLNLSTAGAITGTPTTAQTCSFTVQVADSASAIATADLSITVLAGTGTSNHSTPACLGCVIR